MLNVQTEISMKVLIVDDDPVVRGLVSALLQKHQIAVIEAETGADMLRLLSQDKPDLMILDVGLPDADGFDLLKSLRQHNSIPVIMLTGCDTAIDRVLGLEFGADDYVAKPFEPRELLARVRNILRRCQTGPHQSEAQELVSAPSYKLMFGDYVLNATLRTLVHQDGRVIDLTAGEFDLLLALAEAANRPLDRDQLLDRIRAREWTPFDRSIDVLIGRLRAKIEPDRRDPTFIKTMRNAGYVLAVPVRRVRSGTE